MLAELVEKLVEHALRVGELVGAELRVGVEECRVHDRIPRLQVDDDHRAVGRPLHPVDRPVDRRAINVQRKTPLGRDERLAVPFEVGEVLSDPGREYARRALLLFREPRRLEVQFAPALLDGAPDRVDTRVGCRFHRPVHDRSEPHRGARLGAGDGVDEPVERGFLESLEAGRRNGNGLVPLEERLGR